MWHILHWNIHILVQKLDGCMSGTKEESFAILISSIRRDDRSLSIFNTADVTRQVPMSLPHRGASDSRRLVFIIGSAHSNGRPHQTSGRRLLILPFTIYVMILPIEREKLAGHWK